MPTRFTFGDFSNRGINDPVQVGAGQMTKVGTRLFVMTTSEDAAALYKPIALKQLEEARAFVAAAKSQLDDEEKSNPYAKHYFLTKSFSKDQLETVKAVVGKTQAGLLGDVWLKVGETRTRADVLAGKNAPGGRVSLKADVVGGQRVAKSLAKKYQNMIDSAVLQGVTGMARNGAIHIDPDVLNNSIGVQTLIHEASHKFAGTVDHCYFGHQKPWDPIQGQLKNSEEALKNADSYGWLLFFLGGGTKWGYAPDKSDLKGW